MKKFTKQEDHALMAALLYRTIRSIRPESADSLIKKVASDYGFQRGVIAKNNTISAGDSLTLENYFSYKSLRTRPGTFEEQTVENGPDFITEVTKCCWIDTWKKYGLLEDGKQYCLYCDSSMAKGYNDFHLETPLLMEWNHSSICRFVWPGKTVDEDAIHEKKDALGDRFVMNWDQLTNHMISCAEESLDEVEPGLGKTVCQAAQSAFDKLINSSCTTGENRSEHN